MIILNTLCLKKKKKKLVPFLPAVYWHSHSGLPKVTLGDLVGRILVFKYAGYFLWPSVRVYKKNLAKYNLSLFNF